MKITISMTVKDEEYTIFNSIKSLKEIADQYIILDNGSTDNTIHEIQRAKKELNVNIDLTVNPKFHFIECRNYINNKIEDGWVIIADGDFIYHTSGKDNIYQLTDVLKATKEPTTYLIPFICLDGDFYHYRSKPKSIVPPKIFYNSAITSAHAYIYNKKWTKDFILKGRFPHLNKDTKSKTISFFPTYHVNLKTDEKLWIRRFWSDWRENGYPNYKKYPTVNDYIKAVCENEKEERKEWLKEYWSSLSKFDPKSINSYYPDIVKDMMNNPKYKIKYEDGKIIGRETLY